MLGYVASCLGLASTPPKTDLETSPPASPRSRSPKKPQSAAALSAAAAAASFAAAAAVKPSPSELDRVPPLTAVSSDCIVPSKAVSKVVKVPTRVFISRRSAHKSEFFINLSARKDKDKTVCLSEGHLPFRLNPFEYQLSVVRKGRRRRSDTMNQKQLGCQIPRSRPSTRRRSSRSPNCYFSEADAYASLAAAGWTCTTTESMVQPPDQVQYMYQMPYYPPVQNYQPYPLEYEAQYVEYSQPPSPAFISYSPTPHQPKLSPIPSPRMQCAPCPPCPQCPVSPTRMRRSPPKPNPYDRGLCESADMTSVTDSGVPSRGRSRILKKPSPSHYYPIPFENSNPHFPPRIAEDDEFEEEGRWKGLRRRHQREWKDVDTSEADKSSNNSIWNQMSMTNESGLSSPTRKSPERRVRNAETATQTSVGFSREFVPEEVTVSTQTSLQVLVINRKKDRAGGDIEKRASKPALDRQPSPRSSTPFSDVSSMSSRIPLPPIEMSEFSEISERASPILKESTVAIVQTDSDEMPFQTDAEEGSRGNLEAGRDISPTISFSTGSGSIRDQYATPPIIPVEENGSWSGSPGILGELSTELQALANRVAVLERKRTGSSGTFIPESDVESKQTWYERVTGNKSEEGIEQEEEEDPRVTSECDFAFCNDPGRVKRHTCSFSDMNDADWSAGEHRTSECASGNGGSVLPAPEARLAGTSPREPTTGWCNSTVGVARSSPNLRSSSRPSTRTPTVSTSNEEYVVGREPEVVRNAGVLAMTMPIQLALGNGAHWKKLNMDAGLGDWDYVTTSWTAGVNGGIEEPKMMEKSNEGGEGGENYHAVPPPPPPSPLPSPVLAIGDGEGMNLPAEENEGLKETNLNKVVNELLNESEESEKKEEVEVEEEEEKLEENCSSRDQSSTPFLLDSVLFPPMKPSPAGTPLSMDNLRKRCIDINSLRAEVEKTTSSTQTLMKPIDSDQLQLFSVFQRVVALGESKLDEGLGLVDNVAIEIDLCRLEAITHIAYVIVVVCLFLLLTTLLSFIVN